MMHQQLSLYLAVLCVALHAQQSSDTGNLVPNAGFEVFSEPPRGWFYTGAEFTRVMQFWESPTSASPDIYGPGVIVPRHWRDKGFGSTKPYRGQSMVGLTVYGCEGGKPHCREYIQTQLIEPLVVGQRYLLKYWTNHLPASLRTDGICVTFVNVPVHEPTDAPILLVPEFCPREIVESRSGEWVMVSHVFIAGAPAEYMILGNFRTDAYTPISKPSHIQSLPYAYYYLDEIELTKLPPILDVPVADNALDRAILAEGHTIRLHHVFFDYDRSDFLPRSYSELNTLLRLMREHREMAIEIRGHTDSLGSDEYNERLSLTRAQSVAEYLIAHGIAGDRIQTRGFGSRAPVASNAIEEGRRQNRRVEFVILRM